jgi:hypothetical protein
MLYAKAEVMRNVGIWVFGILATAIVGGIVGSRYDEYRLCHWGGQLRRLLLAFQRTSRSILVRLHPTLAWPAA